jgi:hypothetical protein
VTRNRSPGKLVRKCPKAIGPVGSRIASAGKMLSPGLSLRCSAAVVTAIAEAGVNVVLTVLKWSRVDTTVVRCGCSDRVD